jgi:hypothetical protein
MPLSTKCYVVVNVKKALEIRDEGGVITDSRTLLINSLIFDLAE